jgi:hypothetical protein
MMMKTSEAMSYRRLAADKIVQTQLALERRIAERFPDSGLAQVAKDLRVLGEATAARVAQLAKPNLYIRAGVIAALGVGLGAQAWLLKFIQVREVETSALDWFQGLDAGVNLLAVMGAAIWFLVSLEERWKRRATLAELHALRSLAHVIDMHQLTKDPTVLLAPPELRTASSPDRHMSEFQLTRYLEYCAEMLALTGKLAALYAEDLRDPVVIEAVNDIESLTTNLGRKIWQKITIIGQLDEARRG